MSPPSLLLPQLSVPQLWAAGPKGVLCLPLWTGVGLWTESEATETIPCAPQKLLFSPLHRCLSVSDRNGEGTSPLTRTEGRETVSMEAGDVVRLKLLARKKA